MKDSFSIIVPFGAAVEDWETLIDRFEPLRPRMSELIVVLDGFKQDPPEGAPPYLSVVSTDVRGGPAGARNFGAKKANTEFLAFTDDSCVPRSDWLDAIAASFSNGTDAVVGGVRIPPGGWLGDAISMLGFPAGGNLGFKELWDVRPNGTTDHLSTCNFSIRREIFQSIGGFDEGFPFPGGEDNEFAFRLRAAGYTISFSSNAIITHPPRTGYREFIAWQFRRARGQYYLVQRVGSAKPYVRNRFRSALRSMARTRGRPYFVVMPFLIVTMFVAQASGYFFEHRRQRQPNPPKNVGDIVRSNANGTESSRTETGDSTK